MTQPIAGQASTPAAGTLTASWNAVDANGQAKTNDAVRVATNFINAHNGDVAALNKATGEAGDIVEAVRTKVAQSRNPSKNPNDVMSQAIQHMGDAKPKATDEEVAAQTLYNYVSSAYLTAVADSLTKAK